MSLQPSPFPACTHVCEFGSHLGVAPEQAVLPCHSPFEAHVWGALLLHWVLPGMHEPPHFPVELTQANVHIVVVVPGQLPFASQLAALICTRLLEQL